MAGDAPRRSNKTAQLILKEEAAMQQHFQDLRDLGRQLEDSGVLNGSLKSRGNSWGLHMPLVCPDGAVVAYAWKRQLAGQAGASAVDRTRLALKAFTDQKRRFFPHLEDEPFGQECEEESGVSKKHCSSQGLAMSLRDKFREQKTLSDILTNLEQEVHNVKLYTYQRLDWLKRASSLSSSSIDNAGDSSRESFHNAKRLKSGSGNAPADQVAVIELLVPSVFRAVVSLHPAGSISPDAVAFFSPDESGNYIHARGLSIYHVFRHVTEHADKALQYFLSAEADIALSLLLHWVCSYQTLFSKACCKCKRLLVMDKSSALLLPPVQRPYQQTSVTKLNPNQLSSSAKDLSQDQTLAYHIGCSFDETHSRSGGEALQRGEIAATGEVCCRDERSREEWGLGLARDVRDGGRGRDGVRPGDVLDARVECHT
ncbi:uncharacterized protein A4U43_C07F8040 [Asparagus officinalis]|uniref:Mediator of RNA polymerase II transcription subunit 27 n=1 Tax=Asparagus officinalis TaxID=4686 RepID=A0A5P1EA91_ASPOF|nr:uncharacterized protein A4U43_C07F8040 [Asparagus officinalis]